MAVLQVEVPAHLTAGEQPTLASEVDEDRACWICFATEQEDDRAAWVQPCRCRGSTKWVHQCCLARWIDEKRRGNPHRTVTCTQCRTEYIIFMTEMNCFAQKLEQFENKIKKMCNYVVGGLFVGMLYWTAVTYGAFTVIQVFGREKAVFLLLSTDRVFVLSGLPAIPVSLVVLRMVPLDGMLFRTICHARDFGRMLSFEPHLETTAEVMLEPPNFEPQLDSLSVSCIICGALVLPTVSCFAGICFFPFVGNPLQRAMLGGVTVMIIESLLRLYLRHQQHRRTMSRVVADYNEENLARMAQMDRRAEPPRYAPHLPAFHR